MYTVHILNSDRKLICQPGENLLQLLQKHALAPDAPCGGKGSCGKCRVTVDGKECLACQTPVDRDMRVELPAAAKADILTRAIDVDTKSDDGSRYALAFDIGTTTVVCYLLDGHSGDMLAQASCMNPQVQFGADVISRIQYAMDVDARALSGAIRKALNDLALEASGKAGISADRIGVVSIVGNTAMHHLLLEINPRPLTVPPYMPACSRALELPAGEILPVCGNAVLRILPNIAGFVGADTVGCMVATRFDRLEELTLMIDIGTNGEMVLGNRERRITCSTAAGPAFEGAKIQCGMRGAEGAVDHAALKNGEITWSVIGGGTAVGICGSGLLDLVRALLERGDVDESGYMEDGEFRLAGTEVFLSQKDVREVQLAMAAIRAGIELMCRKMGVTPEQIRKVYLAGAFGNYLDPDSACAIGMIPPVLRDRIEPIGNAAGAGARLCAVSNDEYAYSKELAEGTQFLELASMPEFNDCYVDCLSFGEEEE